MQSAATTKYAADEMSPGILTCVALGTPPPCIESLFSFFFTGTDIDSVSPNGVASDSPGLFGPFTPNFKATYNNDPLTSLDILGALGTYDFTGLTIFNFTVDDGPFNAMGVVYEQMTISAVPLPAAVWLFGSGLVGLVGIARRKKA